MERVVPKDQLEGAYTIQSKNKGGLKEMAAHLAPLWSLRVHWNPTAHVISDRSLVSSRWLLPQGLSLAIEALVRKLIQFILTVFSYDSL